VLRLLEPIRSRLAGLEIILEDGCQEPQYPPVRSDLGQEVAEAIAEHLTSLVDRLEGLPLRAMPGGFFIHKADRTPGGVKIGVIVRRFALAEDGIRR